MKNPLFLHYTYYHCTHGARTKCTQKSVSGKELEAQIDRFLARIEISEHFKKFAINYLHELHEKEVTSRNDIVKSQQNAFTNCLSRIDNLVKLKTSQENTDGSLLSDEEYSQQRMALLREKQVLEELLNDTGQRVERWIKLTEETFEFACTLRERFSNGDPQTKKTILMILGSNLTLRDKRVRIEAKKPFLILEQSNRGCWVQNEPIEPKKHRSTEPQNELNSTQNPQMRGQRDNNRTQLLRNKYTVQ
jgi:hypothetical protein